MKAIIIDDEKNVRSSLTRLLRTFCPEVELVGEAANMAQSLELIANTVFDLAFLDIEMPDGSGIDLLRKVPRRDFQVIFVTAYNQYAIDAFRLSAIDYLLKPVNPDHLIEAVQKAKKSVGRDQLEAELAVLLESMQQPTQQDAKIILKDAENLYIVQVKEILRCEADGGYTKFFLENQREVLTSIHLKEYENMLAKWGFIRSHHSHLVNLQHITRFNKTDGGFVILTDATQVPVSSRKKDLLIKALQNLSA